MIACGDESSFAGAATARRRCAAQQPQGPDMNAYYMLGPDSQSHEGVPKGEMRGPFTLQPGIPRNAATYWVYVPAQYDPRCRRA